jgi:hypothetical protein
MSVRQWLGIPEEWIAAMGALAGVALMKTLEVWLKRRQTHVDVSATIDAQHLKARTTLEQQIAQLWTRLDTQDAEHRQLNRALQAETAECWERYEDLRRELRDFKLKYDRENGHTTPGATS